MSSSYLSFVERSDRATGDLDKLDLDENLLEVFIVCSVVAMEIKKVLRQRTN